MHKILETAIRLEQAAKELRANVNGMAREMVIRDLMRVANLPQWQATEMVDAALLSAARKKIHDIVRPLL